jgi:hypothetical protein
MECRATLDDISLIEGKPLMLCGQFVTKEQKKECVMDLMDFIPDSSSSISLLGGYEATVIKEKDKIIINSHFTAYKIKYGKNIGNATMHDPMISYEKRETSELSFIGGTVEDIYKIFGNRVIHSSSITDEVDIFDLKDNELPKFIRTINEVYPKGLLFHKIKVHNKEEIEEQKEKKIKERLHVEDSEDNVPKENIDNRKKKRELKRVAKGENKLNKNSGLKRG